MPNLKYEGRMPWSQLACESEAVIAMVRRLKIALQSMWETIDDTEEADKIVSEILLNMHQELFTFSGAFKVMQDWAVGGLCCETATLEHLEQCCRRFVRHLDQDVL